VKANNRFFIFIFTIFFCSCGSIHIFSKKEEIEAGTPKHVIIHDNDEIPEKAEFAILDKKEIEQIFLLLDSAIVNHNSESEKYWRIDLSQYKFQLVPFYNDEKEKVIWVNGICIQDLFDYGEEEKSWRETVLIVNDGGKCHFNIYVNLKRSKAFDLVINGEA
jgi:hypothetical protein